MIEANITPLRNAISTSKAKLKKVDTLLREYQETAAFIAMESAQKATALARLTALKSTSDGAYDAIQDVIDATGPIE